MRVLVRGRYNDNPFIACLGFGIIGLLVGVYLILFAEAMTAGMIVVGLGGGLLVLALFRWVVLSVRRLWLEDLEEDRFTLSDKRRTVELADTDLVEMATKVSVFYENGLPKSGQRKTTLLVDAPEFPTELDLSYKRPLKNPDPLAELFERWHTTMMAKAEEELQTSGVIVGTNWSLTRDDMSYQPEGKAKADEVSVSVRSVAAAEIVDRNVCLWADGEDLPFLKVPLGTPNAIALLVMISKLNRDKPASNADAKGLGRVIFERNAGWSKGAISGSVIFGLILLVGGSALIFSQLNNGPPTLGVYILAAGLCVIGIGLPLAGWLQRKNLLRCHERGLHRNINGKVTELRYEDIRSLTYSAVRHYYNGAYTGTIVSLLFTTYDGASTKYTATFKNADDELDNLRDHASRVMAGTMLKKLEAGAGRALDGRVDLRAGRGGHPWAERRVRQDQGSVPGVGRH